MPAYTKKERDRKFEFEKKKLSTLENGREKNINELKIKKKKKVDLYLRNEQRKC